ncbi:hypothetical protein [Actinomadura rupiterrae]|uniref:hypothetical protein n=1 Tax=Actinomadura rupiterrae TaxID=559627 RepID=UPI0020A395A3|nr:hypothetical protein [Actinomadura rupiterrae]MCP2335342.1 hypothetical protein [Actinomadura rupiterrae]
MSDGTSLDAVRTSRPRWAALPRVRVPRPALKRPGLPSLKGRPSLKRRPSFKGLGRPTLKGFGRYLAAHAVFLVVVGGAIALRVVALLGFRSVLWFGDSGTYLAGALDLRPSALRPSGYSLILAAVRPFHGFTGVLVMQHAMGVLIGVMIYALLQRALRRGWPRLWIWVPGVIASVLVLPVLYDGYQIELEHLLMSDVPFTFMLTCGITLAMWWRKTPWWAGALAGFVVGASADVRSVGLPMLIVLVFCLAVRRTGWRTVVAAAVAGMAPLIGYVMWFHSYYGQWSFTSTDQVFLYGRVSDFADCARIKPEPELVIFCNKAMIRDPSVAAAFQTMWSEDSPFNQLPWNMSDPKTNELAGRFAMAAIKKQPGDYAHTVWRDTWRAFAWKRVDYPNPGTVEEYEFPEGGALRAWNAMAAYDYGGRTAQPRVVEPYGGFMRDYQRHYFMPGTFIGVLLGAGLVGIVIRIRRVGGPVLLPFGVGLALLVVPAATADFDYRYVLPSVPFAALAAGLAFAREGRRDPVPAVPAPAEPVADAPEDETEAAAPEKAPDAVSDEAAETAEERESEEPQEPEKADAPGR